MCDRKLYLLLYGCGFSVKVVLERESVCVCLFVDLTQIVSPLWDLRGYKTVKQSTLFLECTKSLRLMLV